MIETPKEKAEELVKKYEPLLYDGYGDFDGYIVSKQCALICVDEILDNRSSNRNTWEYWQEVKRELNKL